MLITLSLLPESLPEPEVWSVLHRGVEYSLLRAKITGIQWAQNICELGLRHSKRGNKDDKARGSKAEKSLSMYRKLKQFFPFNLNINTVFVLKH